MLVIVVFSLCFSVELANVEGCGYSGVRRSCLAGTHITLNLGDLGPGNVNFTVSLVITLCVGSANSINTLCGPGFRPDHD